MNVLHWNVEGLTQEKQSCKEFVEFITNYDIICLSETWTSKNSVINLKGYSNPIHSYRKYRHKRAKRSSGGIIVYIRDSIRKGIKMVKNEVDCLVWLKLEKCFFQNEEDVYIAITYVAPENSPYHDISNHDIFFYIRK